MSSLSFSPPHRYGEVTQSSIHGSFGRATSEGQGGGEIAGGGARRSKCPRRLVVSLIGSASMLVVGLVLSIIGVYWVASKQKHFGGVAFISLGLLCILPGSYGVGEAVGRLMGWRGWDQNVDGNDDLESDFEFARL